MCSDERNMWFWQSLSPNRRGAGGIFGVPSTSQHEKMTPNTTRSPSLTSVYETPRVSWKR